MLKRFQYKKADGSISERTVYQLNLVDNDKLLCVDLSEFSIQEQIDYSALMDEIHKNYIDAIKEVGLGSTFRTFKLEGIQ